MAGSRARSCPVADWNERRRGHEPQHPTSLRRPGRLRALGPGHRPRADRPADEIVKEIEAIKPSQTSFAEFQEANKKKAELIGELAEPASDDARLWLLPNGSPWPGRASSRAPRKEIDEAARQTKDAGLKKEGLFLKAQILMVESRGDASKVEPTVDEFLKIAPKDERGAMLLGILAQGTKDKAKRAAFEDRLLKAKPHQRPGHRDQGSPQAARGSASRSSWNSPTRSRARPSRSRG